MTIPFLDVFWLRFQIRIRMLELDLLSLKKSNLISIKKSRIQIRNMSNMIQKKNEYIH